MSQKITAKNLHYDDSLPPFLARLRGQQAGHSGPDPILALHRRPGQKRTASEEAEDAPLVVDEEGNVVQLEDELEKGQQAEKEADRTSRRDDEQEEGEGEDDLAQRKEKERVAGIGASRKRKVGRVVGEQSDEDKDTKAKAKKRNTEKDDAARVAKASADVRRLLNEDEASANIPTPKPYRSGKEQNTQDGPQKIKSAKKKAAKKIKLSFGDDGD
jgi:hypothetical protein